MTVTRLEVDRDARNAAALRLAVEEFEDADMDEGSAAVLCEAVMGIADRLCPPVRLISSPLPAEGARRLLRALEDAPTYIEGGE